MLEITVFENRVSIPTVNTDNNVNDISTGTVLYAEDATYDENQDPDIEDMRALGYKSSLTREMTSFSNFGLAFGTVSLTTGVSQLWYYGMVTGGPSVMLWSSVVIGFFTQFVSASMAEICSTFPTSGGVYYWASQLGNIPKEYL